MTTHASDEMSRLCRGLTYAFLEQVRSNANVMNAVADEVLRRSDRERSTERRSSSPRYETRREETYREERYEDDDRLYDDRAYDAGGRRESTRREARRSTNLAHDVVSGVLSGIHESIDAPRRVIERFNEGINEREATSRSSSRRAGSARTERTDRDRDETIDTGGRSTRRVKVTEESGPSGESYKSETKVEKS